MRKAISVFVCLLLTLSLFSCSAEENVRYDYNLERYVTLGQLDPIYAEFEDASICTEAEIDEAVFQVLLSYADFAKKEAGPVERYDQVVIEYRVYYNGNEVEDYTEENYRLVTGSEGFGDMDRALGEALIGANIGETRSAEHTFPVDEEKLGDWSGVTVTMKGKVKEILHPLYPELNDEFVMTIGSEEEPLFNSVEEFRIGLQNQILVRKEGAKAEAVFDAFLSGVTVKKYPKREVELYLEDLRNEAKSSAEALGYSLEEYLSAYKATTLERFEAQILKTAEEKVKGDMACILASRKMGTTLSEEEYQKGLEQILSDALDTEEEEPLFTTIEEVEAYYTPAELKQSMLWEKTFLVMMEHAVSTKK